MNIYIYIYIYIYNFINNANYKKNSEKLIKKRVLQLK